MKMRDMTVFISKLRKALWASTVTVVCIRAGSVAYLYAVFLVEGQLRVTQPC
jgi:hypothetical protein